RLLPDTDFWQRQSDGLAILLAPGRHLMYRLPIAFREQVIVADRPHVKARCSMLDGDGRFLVLTLSQSAVRLFEGGREGLRPIDIESIPHRLRDVVGYDFEQKTLQFRSGKSGTTGFRRGTLFHGHGEGDDDRQEEVVKFLRAVDDGLNELLPGNHAPVVVAAVEKTASAFRRLTRLPNVLDDGPTGNFDHLAPHELHARVWPFVEGRFRAEREAAADLVREGLGTGRVVQRIEEVVRAAVDGRVDVMFAATDVERWGRFDPKTRAVTVRNGQREPGDVDLVDLAVGHVLVTSGKVFAVPAAEIPGDH